MFKGLKLLKNPGNGRLNNLNDPVLNVLTIKRLNEKSVNNKRLSQRSNVAPET